MLRRDMKDDIPDQIVMGITAVQVDIHLAVDILDEIAGRAPLQGDMPDIPHPAR
jgi:hypothetical protein